MLKKSINSASINWNKGGYPIKPSVNFRKVYVAVSDGFAEPQVMDLFHHVRLSQTYFLCNCKV